MLWDSRGLRSCAPGRCTTGRTRRSSPPIITAVFPPFFSDYAAAGLPPAEATARFAWATTIAVAIIAVLGPVLGAIADYRRSRSRCSAVFMLIGVMRHAADGHDRPRRLAVRRRRSSSSPTSASPPAWSSTTRCCRTSPRPTRSTASRRRAIAIGFSAAASCCSSTWPGFFSPPTFGLAGTGRGHQAVVRQRRRCGGCCSRCRSSGACRSRRHRSSRRRGS